MWYFSMIISHVQEYTCKCGRRNTFLSLRVEIMMAFPELSTPCVALVSLSGLIIQSHLASGTNLRHVQALLFHTGFCGDVLSRRAMF